MVSDFRIGYGQQFNYFKRIAVSRTTFGDPNDGYRPDIFIPFITASLSFLNEDPGANAVEYSFDGFNTSGDLDPTLPTQGLTFDNRIACKVWFRVRSGSTGPISVRVEAWGIP